MSFFLFKAMFVNNYFKCYVALKDRTTINYEHIPFCMEP